MCEDVEIHRYLIPSRVSSPAVMEREMGSGEREQQTRHPTVGSSLSSLIVRPSKNEGGGSSGGASDYETREFHREKNNAGSIAHSKNRSHSHTNGNSSYKDRSPIYSRSPRYSGSPLRSRPLRFSDRFDGHGNGMHEGSVSPLHQRMHAGSLSPPHRRKLDHHYGSDFDHVGRPHHGPGYKVGRGFGRFREFSPPPYGRGKVGRPFGRGFGYFEELEREPSLLAEEPIGRNNPNISPREGDWICSEPSCGNLNFARRAYCNNCNKLRFGPRGNGPGGSPRGSFFRPPSPHAPVTRFFGSPMDPGKGRDMNGYGSPRGWGGGGLRETPRSWGRDEPRDFKMDPPPLGHVERFSGDQLRRERAVYPEVGYRGRGKFDRSMPPEWGHRGRGRGRGNFFNDRRWDDEHDHRLSSPPLPVSPPRRGPWVSDRRDRSRSPFRSGQRDYGRDPFMSRGRDYRRGMGRIRRFHGHGDY